MTGPDAKLAVVVVSESDVRRYAEDCLPPCDHEPIEGALLNDERARGVVRKHAGRVSETPLSDDLEAEIKSALDQCQASVVSYELLSRASGPKKIVNFGAGRFVERWALLGEMLRVVKSSDKVLSTETTLDAKSVGDLDARGLAATAVQRDSKLMDALYQAFEHAKKPAWKAKIADWISKIEADVGRMAWLTGTLKAKGLKAHAS